MLVARGTIRKNSENLVSPVGEAEKRLKDPRIMYQKYFHFLWNWNQKLISCTHLKTISEFTV